jgi:hypothetical protein
MGVKGCAEIAPGLACSLFGVRAEVVEVRLSQLRECSASHGTDKATGRLADLALDVAAGDASCPAQ